MPVFFSPLWLLWQKHLGQHIISVDKHNSTFCNTGRSASVYFNPRKEKCTQHMLESRQIMSLFCHCSHGSTAKPSWVLTECRRFQKFCHFSLNILVFACKASIITHARSKKQELWCVTFDPRTIRSHGWQLGIEIWCVGLKHMLIAIIIGLCGIKADKPGEQSVAGN